MNTLNTQVRASITARLATALRKLAKDRRGATTVEYLVLLAVIGLGGIAAAQGIAGAIGEKATDLGGQIGGIAPGGN